MNTNQLPIGPRLINTIGTASVHDIESYLRALSVNSPDRLSFELTETDLTGKMPLHFAIEKGDFAKVKVLLSFDAPVTAKIGNKTFEDYAKELANQQPQDERKRVYALIKSRGRWQSMAAKDQGVVFSRSMKAIEEAVGKIQGAIKKSGVLFFGITGEGKSTFINYLAGVDYTLQKIKRNIKVIPNGPELAPVGHSTTSATSLPQLIEIKGRSYVLIDLAGLEDTREVAVEICAAASICMLTKQLHKIQAIPLVCSWETLADAKMVKYRKAAHNVGAMLSQDPKTMENVILMVTKPLDDLEEKEVRERLEELSKGEGWVGSVSSTPLKREDVNEDIWRKHCVRLATEAILSHQENIVIANVASSEARVEFQKVMDALEKKSKSPDHFDFKTYSRFMTQFKTVLESMIVHYNALIREKMSQEDILKKLATQIAEINLEKNTQEADLKKNENQKAQPFTEDTFNKKIIEEKNKLSDLRKRSQAQREHLHQAELDSKIKTAKLENIEKDGEKLIDTVHRGWVCEKTEDRIEKDWKVTGRKVTADGITYDVIETSEKKVPGKEKTVSESVSYPSTVPIKRFVDRSQGGKFEINGFTPGALQISGTFISYPGAQGGVNLSVDLYGDVKDFPDAQDKRNKLEQELRNAERERDIAKQNLISDDEIETVSERLKAIELDKISAVGDHKRTKEICDMQIQFIQAQLDKTQAKLVELNKQEGIHKVELDDLKLQLEVNRDLFTNLKTIIQVMDFKGDAIEQFMTLPL